MENSLKPAEFRTVITPPSGWAPVDFRELWAFRELLYFLVLRNVKVKYKQTIIGIAWAVLQPLVAMLVFTLFFGKLAKLPSDGLPYSIFAFIGLLPWTYFATALQFSSTSLVTDSQLVKKIYFPRALLPASTSVAALLDLAIATVFLLVLLRFYGFHLMARMVWLPFFVMLAFVTAFGFGLWLSAINVKYRDVQYTVPFLIQIWFFLTPVVYPSSMIPERLRFLLGLNPMAAVTEGFRWALVNKPFPSAPMMLVSTLVAAAVLASGLYYFRRMENEFADVL